MEDTCPKCGLSPCHPRCINEIEAWKKLKKVKIPKK